MNGKKHVTNRGIVKSDVKEDDFSVSIEHELVKVKWDRGDGDLKKVIGEVMNMEFDNEEAITYRDNLKVSYVLYGRDGVRKQLRYIIVNVEDDDKEDKIKKLLEDI